LIDIQFRHFFYVSNLLSIVRFFLLIPIFYYLSKEGTFADVMILVTIAVASLTDMLDGYFARRLKQKTDLGKILDPLADKIIIVLGLLALVLYRDFPLALVLLLGYRDLLILIGGIIIVKKSGKIIESNIWGKANTSIAAIAAFVFIISDGWWGTYILMAITYLSILISGTAYMLVGFRQMQTNMTLRIIIGFLALIPTGLIFYLTPGHLLGIN
jgi:CDP-diacylglycerol--glycerol-3-phosphate 3-phosphatidyltransferase